MVSISLLKLVAWAISKSIRALQAAIQQSTAVGRDTLDKAAK